MVGEPARFLVEIESLLPGGGAAVDVAAGTGRHGLWLAGLGYDVTLVDISPVGLAAATAEADRRGVRVDVIERDLERDGLPGGTWDVIVIHYYLDRALLSTVPRALRPGGVVAFCQPTVRDLEGGGGMSPQFLLDDGEIADLAGRWDPRCPGAGGGAGALGPL